MTADDAPRSTRYQIIAGGEPTAEELAAVTIALTPVAVSDGETSDAADLPGWLRAALHEGVGAPPLTSADQVAGLR